MASSGAPVQSSDSLPRESDVAQLSRKRKPGAAPVTLVIDHSTFVNTSHELCVTAQSPDAAGQVDVVLNYVPEGELHFDQFYVDEKLRLVVGFVPENARRSIIRLFRYNRTLTLL